MVEYNNRINFKFITNYEAALFHVDEMKQG